ncbi:hypothetical protein [Streptomyces sp. NPDC088180]|uniref:hypothetical protein n=1 Tax=Streptomyces sp. NPDC088180 TaxID=3365837 RepID=UPI00381EB5A6
MSVSNLRARLAGWGTLREVTTKLLVDGFTTKVARTDQELRVLVYPSSIDPSSAHLRHLARCLAAHLAVRSDLP